MSNQMFSSQEQEARRSDERITNTDPREQHYQESSAQDFSEYTSYEQGYNGFASHIGGEKLNTPQPLSSKRWLWITLIVIGLIVAGGSILNALIGVFLFIIGAALIVYIFWQLAFNQATPLPSQRFTVQGRADLTVDNLFGAIRIHHGPVNSVEVSATRYHSSLWPGRLSYPLDITQQEDQINVRVWSPQARRAFYPGDVGRVDLDITVPEECDLHIRSDASTIAIDGIHGLAQIRTNAGTIDTQNATFLHRSSLQTNAGTINVQNVKLEGDTRLETNAGTISFRGEIKPGHQYAFETNAGTIDVALPAHTPLSLEAKTDLGVINSSFDEKQVIRAGKALITGLTRVINSSFDEKQTSDGPRAQLYLRTNMGTINVRPYNQA